MQTRCRVFARIGAIVAVGGLVWSAPALAQKSTTTKFDGTASGGGTVSRTITDISEPNSPQEGSAGIQEVQGGSVTVPVSTGMTAKQIGRAFRDSINANTALLATGYSATFAPATDTTQVKMTRQIGSFSVVDGNTVPGVTMTIIQPPSGSSELAPALSPFGLALLAAGLAALAYRQRRRRTTA